MHTASRYGLEPNWAKTMHLRVRHTENLQTPSGDNIKTVNQAVYLGALLVATGSASGALARRLGEARGAFVNLCAVWRHANLAKHMKLRIFEACIATKLLYSLECECLLLADRKRLNGFYCRCLRTILNIPHSMISHVSNDEVLKCAGALPLCEKLCQQQLLLFGVVARLPDNSVVRRAVFEPGSLVPTQSSCSRRRGRPKLTWISVVHAMALKVCNHDAGFLHNMLCRPDSNLEAWKALVKR